MSEAAGDGQGFAERRLGDLQLPDRRHAVLWWPRLADRSLYAHRAAVPDRGARRPGRGSLRGDLPLWAILTRSDDVGGNCPVTTGRMSWGHQTRGGQRAR